MNTLYVVIESFDSRKGGHEVKVHGCYFDKGKALERMTVEAKKLQQELEAELEQGDEFFNVIHGEDYFVFEVKEGQIFQ